MKYVNRMPDAKVVPIRIGHQLGQDSKAIHINKNQTFKKSILLTLAALLGAIGISNAQLSEGDFMLESDLGSGLIFSQARPGWIICSKKDDSF